MFDKEGEIGFCSGLPNFLIEAGDSWFLDFSPGEKISWYLELVFKSFSWFSLVFRFSSFRILVTIDSKLLDHCDQKTEEKELC
jgi:hypothetical protein